MPAGSRNHDHLVSGADLIADPQALVIECRQPSIVRGVIHRIRDRCLEEGRGIPAVGGETLDDGFARVIHGDDRRGAHPGVWRLNAEVSCRIRDRRSTRVPCYRPVVAVVGRVIERRYGEGA